MIPSRIMSMDMSSDMSKVYKKDDDERISHDDDGETTTRYRNL